MMTQQEWDLFSKNTFYLKQKFDRCEILQVICKCGLDGGLFMTDIWPQGVVDYPFKMRFRKCNNHRGAVYVFNDFCVNNEPFSSVSVAFREYNAKIFGMQYVKDVQEFLKPYIFKVIEAFSDEINATFKRRTAFLQDIETKFKRLQIIATETACEK